MAPTSPRMADKRWFPIDEAFVVFDEQDSGCVSWGVERAGERWFVKEARTRIGALGLARAQALHAAVQHHVIVGPRWVFDGPDGATLVYPWHEGIVLNAATTSGADRSSLARFQRLPIEPILDAVDAVLEAHAALAAAGWIAVDLYDGCLLYDFDAGAMHLVDLDEYRPGPFVLAGDRLPGSSRYMAPEQWSRGALIDHRTTVFALGKVALHLLSSPAGWRGTDRQAAVVHKATQASPADRHEDVATFVDEWRSATIRSA